MDSSRRTWLVDSLLIFALAAILVLPLFRLKYLDAWGSIESIFISDARFLRDHHFHVRWQPDWYCGTRWDYIYPPALRYSTALIALYPHMTTARAYHIYIALFYCLGIVGVYWLARTGGGSRSWGIVAAVLVAIVSPSFLFLKEMCADARGAGLPPERLGALVRYGEGPHITALGWLGIALACAWRGLRRGHNGWLVLTILSIVMVVSNNFYGATALVLFFPALAWALWVTTHDRSVWWRAALAAVTSYGLCAFWLVPSYVQQTMLNLRHVSKPGTTWARWLAIGVAAAFAGATWRWARNKPRRAWPIFVLGSATLFTLNVLGNYYFDFRILGEPMRLVPEFDMVLILLALLPLEWLWRTRRVPRWTFALPALAVLFLTRTYWRHSHSLYPRSDSAGRIEYQLTKWIHENIPDDRVLATGSLRFWYNAWFDGQLVGGGSEQGLLNQYIMAPMWSVMLDPDPTMPVKWLEAIGANAVVVHDQHSTEIYHDIHNPGKFRGVLDVLYDNGKGDVIYRVPRRFGSLARVVETRALEALPPMPPDGDNRYIGQYVDVLEKGPDSEARLEWLSTEKMRVHARLEPGQSLVIEETWDPAWRARTDGRDIPVRQSMLQFMRLDPRPGEHDIEIEFTVPLENRVGRVFAALSAVAVAGLLVRRRI